MAKAAEKTIDIWKKKRWHKIIAPKLFNEMIIGETPALEPNTLVGRTLRINMLTLTGDIKKQSIDITFEIEKVMGDTAYTRIRKFEMNPAAVRRFIRRGKNRVDDSFVCLTADNKKVRIKPFLVTFAKTSKSVLCVLRVKSRQFLARVIRGMTYEMLCREIAIYSLQKMMRDTIKKIYPLRVCEIRVMEIYEGEARVLEVAPEAVVQAPKEEKPQEAPKEKVKEASQSAETEKATEDDSAKEENSDEEKLKRSKPKKEKKEG